MKTNLVLAIFIVSSLFFASHASWNLVWSDEFENDGLADSTRWDYEVGFIRNSEAQYYTHKRSENARSENGMLVIESRKESYEDAEYTSASLHTKNSASWVYGRIEVRAKLPTGKGMWPAIWMLGVNINDVGWPECGELDIMENVGYDPDKIHANIHCASYNHVLGTGKGSTILVDAPEEPYEVFHTYAIEWFEDRIDFYIDSSKYFTFQNEFTGNDTWPFDKEHYLILNSAVGGSWGGQQGIDDAIFPQKYFIDYVRVYEWSAIVSSISDYKIYELKRNSIRNMPGESLRIFHANGREAKNPGYCLMPVLAAKNLYISGINCPAK